MRRITNKIWNQMDDEQRTIFLKLHDVPLKFLEKHVDDFTNPGMWEVISNSQKLSEDFIEKYKDKVNWKAISSKQSMTRDFIIRHLKDINLNDFLTTHIIHESFLRELVPFMDHDCWYSLFMFNKISEDFIREFEPRVNWYAICTYQYLSEKFIEEAGSKIYWSRLKNCYSFTNKFMERHKEDIDWYSLSRYKVYKNTKKDRNFVKRWKDCLFLPLIDLENIFGKEFKEEIYKSRGIEV